MRKIYDPITGSDVTSTVQTTLQSGRTLVTAYLYRTTFQIFWNYNPYGSFGSYTFTDADFPIFVNWMQIDNGAAKQIGHWLHDNLIPTGLNFYPEPITHDKLSYGIGFEDKPVEIDWAIDDSKVYNVVEESSLGGVFNTTIGELQSPANCTVKQGMQMGFFTDCPFWIHEAVFTDFPSRGGTFLGTTLMFRGYIRGVTATRSRMKLKLSSLMDVFQSVQVPTQTITPNNRALPYIPLAIGTYGGDFAGGTPITERVISFTTAETIPAGALQDYWLTFNPASYAGFSPYKSGYPAAPAFRIQGNDASSAGSVTVYFYQPYALPNPYAAVTVYAQLANVGGPTGFKYLPPPEMSA